MAAQPGWGAATQIVDERRAITGSWSPGVRFAGRGGTLRLTIRAGMATAGEGTVISGATLGFEAKLWEMVDALRSITRRSGRSSAS